MATVVPVNFQLSKNIKKVVFGVIGFIVFLILIGMFTTTVGTGEVAVMTRFGRVTGQELGEGFHIKHPFDTPNKYDSKVQKIETAAAAASKDLQDVNSKIVVNYELERGKISDVHKNVGIDYQEKLIDPAIQEVFKASTAKFDATQLITDRSAVKGNAYELLRDRLSGYGITVRDLSITDFSFSPEFAKAIEAKQVAQQAAEQAKFNAQKAEQDAQATINRAVGEAESQRLVQTSVTSLTLQKEAIEKWDGKLPTYMGQGTVFNIPLQ